MGQVPAPQPVRAAWGRGQSTFKDEGTPPRETPEGPPYVNTVCVTPRLQGAKCAPINLSRRGCPQKRDAARAPTLLTQTAVHVEPSDRAGAPGNEPRSHAGLLSLQQGSYN